jgi:hypothetical protein
MTGTGTEDMLRGTRAEHRLETTILRVSKQTYLEAYEVMIKTNRFVEVSSVRGLPVRLPVTGLGVPMVTMNEEAVEQFESYVLAVHLRQVLVIMYGYFATDST